MKIKVERRHIQKGKRADCYKCPVALALKEAGYKGVEVGDGFVEFDGITYNMRRGTRFIRRFDNNLSVKPTTIELVQE